MDENTHLAKVKVAGSNPVFRSIVAGQGRFFNPPILWDASAEVHEQHPVVQETSRLGRR